MTTTTRYESRVERRELITQQEALGMRLVHDDFDADWQRGEEPRGTLTWTDELAGDGVSVRNLDSEVDTLAAELASIKDIDGAYQELLAAKADLDASSNANQIRAGALRLADALIAWAEQVMAERD